MSIDQFRIEFTKSGDPFDATQTDQFLQQLSQYSDVFVVTHGWNNDTAEADNLFDELLGNVSLLLKDKVVAGLDGRRFAAVRVYWPSKRFADSELIPGGGASAATSENDRALHRLLEQLKEDPNRLGGADVNPQWDTQLTTAQTLVSKLETSADARREFVECLRATLDSGEAHADDGSQEFFDRDVEEIFAELSAPVVAPLPAGAGGASSVGSGGGAAGLRDIFEGVTAAARRIANYASYYRMKSRAGLVGRTGVNHLIREVRRKKPEASLHLVGHSFGGRLVTAAADALDPNTPAVTVSLLQAAYSHNGMAEKFDGTHNGFFRKLVSEKRASGPIVVTHTKNDRAVGIAYPLASRIARQKAAALGDQDDPYGGIGRNGAQHTPEAVDVTGGLQDLGRSYDFAPGKVFNLNADRFIKNHSDVRGPEVANAILHAVRTV